MADAALPNPITPNDEFLLAVHDRIGDTNTLLRQILDRLPERPAPERPDGTVELTEPARPATATPKAVPKTGTAGKRGPAGTPSRPAQRRKPTTPKNT